MEGQLHHPAGHRGLLLAEELPDASKDTGGDTAIHKGVSLTSPWCSVALAGVELVPSPRAVGTGGSWLEGARFGG